MWTWRRLQAVAAVGAIALVACGGGCGSGQGRQDVARVEQPATGTGGGAQATPAVAVQLPARDSKQASGATQRESAERESLAPEIGLVPVDTLVAPGQVVDLAVRATPDVNRVALKDDGGGTLALVKDADGATWRVSYRVPMRPAHERWGVSLTARTAEGRWHRVWVFLHVRGLDEAGSKSPGGADTSRTGGETGNGVGKDTPPEVPGSASGR